MKIFVVKLFTKTIAGINSKQFEQVCEWVMEAGRDPIFRTGFEQAMRVVSLYNANFAQQASWVVRTVVQVAYYTCKLNNEDT